MTFRSAWMTGLLLTLAGCTKDAGTGRPRAERLDLSPAQRDAEALGQAVFEMVDRAMDYRGSHRGRPAASFRQMGLDSLTPSMVRRVVNIDRLRVITVAFRRPDEHEIVSCRGDSDILEEATLQGGQFTLMCTTRSGTQQLMKVGGLDP